MSIDPDESGESDAVSPFLDLSTLNDLGPYSRLCGSTDADNLRHLMVRLAFLDEFLNDEQVDALFETWAARIGLVEKAPKVLAIWTALKTLLGVSRERVLGDFVRSASFSAWLAQQSPEQRALVDLVGAVETLNQAFDFGEPTKDAIAEEARAFVVALGLPWPWLAVEVVSEFFIAFYEMVYFAAPGLYAMKWVDETPDAEPAPLVETWWVEPITPAPSVEHCFGTYQGETLVAAIERLDDEYRKVRARLEAAQEESGTPPGRLPSAAEVEALRRDARWFYLHRVRRVSINAIVRVDYDGDFTRRKDIRSGIVRAQQLLTVTNCVF